MTRLSRVDREALGRAFAAACSESPEEAARFEEMLRKEGWEEACETASYVCHRGSANGTGETVQLKAVVHQ
jgi:hypothetical protein